MTACRHLFLLFLLCCAILPSQAGGESPDPGRVDEIARWLGAAPCSATPGVRDRAFWRQVARSPAFKSAVETAQAIAAEPFRALPDDLYLEFSRNGNRSRYQNVYFRKLKNFRALVVAECIENRGRFLPAIEQAIASYAADKTWVLPAHDRNLENFEGRQITIDLFSSEVACDLANADHMLNDRLTAATRKKLREEIARRIFTPYQSMVREGKPGMWWLTGTNNWNAVCLANVTGTALALLEPRDERAFYVAAAEKYIPNFLRGFTADGYCSEGIGYWNYGFGCFVRLRHLLATATDERLVLFALPKARSAALFARRIEITPGQYPAFADCSVGAKPSARIMRYVTRHYDLRPTRHELDAEATPRWLDEFGVFSFLFDPPAATTETAEPALRDWFQEAGILVSRGGTAAGGLPVGVALKGGHNAEHHNHNDVGSYVLCVGDAMPLTDPGAEEYTRRTFSRQRYVSDVLNSFGHPVPLVAGQKQRTGRRAEGKVLKLGQTDEADTLKLDLASAYDVPALERLHRTFVFRREPASLTITDEVQFDAPQPFGTALITYQPVRVLSDHELRIGTGQEAILVRIDAGDRPLTITETLIDEDVRGGRQPTRIGLDLQQPAERATIQLTVSPPGGGS